MLFVALSNDGFVVSLRDENVVPWQMSLTIAFFRVRDMTYSFRFLFPAIMLHAQRKIRIVLEEEAL